MPDATEGFPAVAFTVQAQTRRTGYRFCACRTSASQTCVHLKKLSQMVKALEGGDAGVAGPEAFRDSFWYRFAVAMAESSRHRLDSVGLRIRGENGTSGEIRAYSGAGELIMSYLSEGPDRSRFVDRCTLSSDADTVPTRADVLHRLALLTLTDDERMMQERGFKTVRMAQEEQFWYRLAYHGFREFGIEGCVLSPAIEESSGDFFIQGADTEGQPLLRAAVPRKQVKRVLSKLKDVLVNNAGLAIEPLCLDAVFDVALTKAMDLEIRPLLRQIRKNGEARFFEREDLAQFQYGDLYYIKELGTLVEDPYPKSPPSFAGLKRTVVPKSRVPLFLADHGQDMEKDLFRVAPEVQRLRIMNSFDRIEITPFAIDRDWYWLSIVYGDGSQHIKNPQTKAFDAAERINADIKLGLTGTPIENSLAELKSLLDLTVPGYLGDNDVYESRYLVPIEAQRNLDRRRELRRLISPFTLRRKKQSVLAELPEKIEDMRTCLLSEEQVKLYRDAVNTRAKPLLSSLAEDKGPVPYMHIFALLNLLKQICNHPALVAKTPEAYIDHESGKWDLFTELLEESLDSGQKIVVYSQYLGMIDIIARYLTERRIAYESLTGASRNRGKIVDRFNSDPDCRVFVGSLKAGGVGIDLVAASVVIHYDRWWNAAKEDQATDRVHRIGQTRGVQVFKLVTEGTLEEKIAAIIDKKRNLMDSIVKEDDPSLLKTFSKDDLIELLSMPGRLE
ncbi:MAG: DEAD/DEAH box helicase [Desulfobacterales bacterium]|nr:DEAD/DEAH box helicase [Desulfobacterales bacterium]